MRKRFTFIYEQRGFTLPVILLISVGLMIVGLSLIQSTSSVRNSLAFQHQQRLSAEAAEAGTVYANYCLSVNDFNQTWGPGAIVGAPRPNLTQKTDCTGAPIASAPNYLMENGTTRIGFSIGDLTSSDRIDGALVFPASGTYEQTRGNSSAIADSLGTTRKRVVEWGVFKASVSASGSNKTCAIVSNELYCWGKNATSGEPWNGQLGDGTTTDSLTPVKVVQDPGVLANKVIDDVVSAQYHSCALATGKVYCWGYNGLGELGVASPSTYSSRPVEVGGALAGKTVTDIGATGNTTCAIAGGKIYCWGENNKGTVGVNTTVAQYNSPQLVYSGASNGLPSNYVATKLSTSGTRSHNMCAIADGKAYCWGNNERGQVGIGVANSTNILYPRKVTDTGVLSGKTVTAISQDGYFNGDTEYPHVCAVADMRAYCWGANSSGQLGNNSTTNSSVPVAVSTSSGAMGTKDVTDIVAGLIHTCALANARVYCWGGGGSGMIGDGSNFNRTTPRAVKADSPSDALYGKTITAIGGGSNRGCAITIERKTYCWGVNNQGQLGNGNTTNSNVPVPSQFLDPKAPVFIF